MSCSPVKWNGQGSEIFRCIKFQRLVPVTVSTAFVIWSAWFKIKKSILNYSRSSQDGRPMTMGQAQNYTEPQIKF